MRLDGGLSDQRTVLLAVRGVFFTFRGYRLPRFLWPAPVVFMSNIAVFVGLTRLKRQKKCKTMSKTHWNSFAKGGRIIS